jgi:hypothetical protein
MTNFDPGGLVMLLTVLVTVPAGVVSIGGAHLAARLGVGNYETDVVAILAVLLLAWVVAGFVVSDGMFLLLAVTLAMAGAFAVTRSVRDASYGWVLGVVLLFLAWWAAAAAGVYQGVDDRGRPQGPIARNLEAFYLGGLLVGGVVGGKLVELGRHGLGEDVPVAGEAGS